MLEQLKVKIWKLVNCPRGKHLDPASKPNFCGACGHQMNPNAFSDYKVILNDGSKKIVTAINEKHATSLVIYGDNLAFNGQTGQPIGRANVHSDNVKSVTQI